MSDQSNQQHELPFTGERFTPQCVREIWYEHWHRYAFASPLAEGLEVVDVACGEGYGSHLLSACAARVTGIDIDPDAVAHANKKYARSGKLTFLEGDCASLPLPDASADLVVSFETLEHIEAQREMIAECRRILKPDGCLLISTPDRTVYNKVMGAENEFHVKELEREEFVELLAAEFPVVRLFGQKLVFLSALWDEQEGAGSWQLAHGEDAQGASPASMPWKPVYHVALCAGSQDNLPQLPSLHLFGDAQESVYRHYNDEVGKSIKAGLLLAERDKTIEQLQAALDLAQSKNSSQNGIAKRRWWNRWLG